MRLVHKGAPPRGAFSFFLRLSALPIHHLLGVFFALGWVGLLHAADPRFMTEIRYEEKEADQPVYVSRILILGERLRMDYGRDEEDFILFDRRENTTWHVSREGRRLVGIVSYPSKSVWPNAWRLTVEKVPSGPNELTQVRVDGKLCLEFKSAPILDPEARMLRDFRKALAGNQTVTWLATPEELRDPCNLAVDVKEAGIEYRRGLLIAARYWDGRSRVYQSHQTLVARPELFELPSGYERFMVGEPQAKPKARQPSASQRR